MSWNAYHLNENFGEIFRQMVLVIFLAPKTGTGLSCTVYKIPANFTLSLDMKPAWHSLVIQTNGTEHFGRFGKNGKKGNTTKDITFSRKIFSGMNRSILILHGISGLSIQDIQMVSAHDVT